ncbi:GrpB family protein [Rhizobium sp. ZPR3]|uniref:GrpB family protein n=2 Tax=unclassified Rhizobium TaxID=2613769 RepID=A0AAU7SRM3_9HYPH
MKPPIVLTPYDPIWTDLFERERTALQRADIGWFRAIHHVGSTSIPGIAAKPIIDILVGLRCDDDGRACVEAMHQLGYEYRGDGGIPGRHYYRKGTPHTHHVHMWVESHPEYGRHLRFRDYLRSHPEEARAYEALKRELAERFVSDTLSYSQAKDEFCQRIDELARRQA